MFELGLPELTTILIIILIMVLTILPYRKIFAKAGFSGWWSLTQLVPLLNTLVLFYSAFTEWPIHHRELRKLVSDKVT